MLSRRWLLFALAVVVLAAVLAASVEDLMTVKAEDTKGRTKGIGAETALDIAALHEVADFSKVEG